MCRVQYHEKQNFGNIPNVYFKYWFDICSTRKFFINQ